MLSGRFTNAETAEFTAKHEAAGLTRAQAVRLAIIEWPGLELLPGEELTQAIRDLL